MGCKSQQSSQAGMKCGMQGLHARVGHKQKWPLVNLMDEYQL